MLLSNSLYKRREKGNGFTFEEEVAFDISKLLGCTCELQIITKKSKATGESYNYIQNMLTPRNGVKKVDTITPQVYFSFEDKFTDIPEMPDWIVSLIKDSLEWMDIKAGDQLPDEPPPFDDSDIPF